MRKILLLTIIGGLGFSPQIFSALHGVSHSIAISYLQTKTRDVCLLPCAGIVRDGDVLFSKIAPLYICSRILLKSNPGSSTPSTKVYREQDLVCLTDLCSAPDAVFIPRNISTVTTLHFNRMVNRKRILLSG